MHIKFCFHLYNVVGVGKKTEQRPEKVQTYDRELLAIYEAVKYFRHIC